MKAKPFDRVKISEIFRDVDGNIILKQNRVFGDNEGRTPLNCVILVPNKPDIQRGDILFKNREVYCEVLDDREISELKFVILPEETIEE